MFLWWQPVFCFYCVLFTAILDDVHTIPAEFENGTKFGGRNSLQSPQECTVKQIHLHIKNRSDLFWKRRRMFHVHHCQMLTQCRFQNVPVRIPFSKSTILKICMCRFRWAGGISVIFFTVFKLCLYRIKAALIITSTTAFQFSVLNWIRLPFNI